MRVYLGKDPQAATEALTATHVTVRCLTGGVEEGERNMSEENFFTSLSLLDDLATLKTSYCSTGHPASSHGPFNPVNRAPPQRRTLQLKQKLTLRHNTQLLSFWL
jgi:hypothetical protein